VNRLHRPARLRIRHDLETELCDLLQKKSHFFVKTG
jgi:hypothetical protein